MICRKPYRQGLVEFGCGQCIPCRVNRRRVWVQRLVLESRTHEGCSSFVTLTYGDDRPELSKRDLQLWLKRIRDHVSPVRLRFFAVGEYGDVSGRPHYHVALFGLPVPESHGWSVVMRTGVSGKPELQCLCSACTTVRDSWGLGRIDVRLLCKELAQYLAGYVMKKLVKPTEGTREPEFVRMSLRPGIGAAAMPTVGDQLSRVRSAGVQFEDVPTVFRHGRSTLPLGRYLSRKLRESMDFEEVGAQPGWQVRKVEEALRLYEEEGSNTTRFVRRRQELADQASVNVETQARIRAQRKKL